jgi:hypothetical protein
MRFGLVVKVVSTGNVYKWMDSDVGTPNELDVALWSLMNETGSGIVLQVFIIHNPDLGEENQPRFRLARVETLALMGKTGTSKTLQVHDTSKSISDVYAYAGPMQTMPVSNHHGLPMLYQDYQMQVGGLNVTRMPTLGAQQADVLRMWSGVGPYMTTTKATGLNYDLFGRGEYDVWPGDRRGCGGGIDAPIILRPGEGLALIGGGGGNIETSKLAYLDIEIAGYVEEINYFPVENDVRNNVDYGPTGVEYNGDLVLPVITDVKSGVSYGADGTEYTGTYAGGGSGAYRVIGSAVIRRIK